MWDYKKMLKMKWVENVGNEGVLGRELIGLTIKDVTQF